VAADALAKILVDRKLLGANETARWLQTAEEEGRFLDEILIREEVFSRTQLLEILENHYFCPAMDLQAWQFNAGPLLLIPEQLAKRHLAFPVGSDESSLRVVVADPDDTRAAEALQLAARRQLQKSIGLRHDLKQSIEQHYTRLQRERSAAKPSGNGKGLKREAAPVAAQVSSSSIQRLNLNGKQPVAIVDAVIDAAARLEASDIHIQCGEQELAIRFRLDGILQTIARLPKEMAPGVTSRIKVLGEMDVAERRLPQDGRHTTRKGQHVFDLRISCLPAQFGEKVVIRLLSKNVNLLKLENLKMPASVEKLYQDMINLPQGFYLVTGPTGSGKTTTLYATLNAIDRESVNVITLEDPIEYTLEKITQVAIHDDIGLTFAAGLRSILRQDPDVILVGEMRDVETVTIACRAALTGHKVFSTLHTNDTAQAVTRLLDMGTPPYLITATLRGILAQRLVRRICEHCKETYPINETEWAILGYPKVKELHRGAGCEQCGNAGYKGRMAIFEYLRVEDHMHRLILDRASPYTIRHFAQRSGMLLMSDFAKRAVLEGKTTVPEIQRAILSEEGKEQLCQKCQRVVNLDFTICPFCQHVLKEKCVGCGNPVEANWEACPTCGHEIDREWQRLHCRSCLAPVDGHWEKCPYCGGEVQ
jgi:type IV pilus assembly protein PilB